MLAAAFAAQEPAGPAGPADPGSLVERVGRTLAPAARAGSYTARVERVRIERAPAGAIEARAEELFVLQEVPCGELADRAGDVPPALERLLEGASAAEGGSGRMEAEVAYLGPVFVQTLHHPKGEVTYRVSPEIVLVYDRAGKELVAKEPPLEAQTYDLASLAGPFPLTPAEARGMWPGVWVGTEEGGSFLLQRPEPVPGQWGTCALRRIDKESGLPVWSVDGDDLVLMGRFFDFEHPEGSHPRLRSSLDLRLFRLELRLERVTLVHRAPPRSAAELRLRLRRGTYLLDQRSEEMRAYGPDLAEWPAEIAALVEPPAERDPPGDR